MSTQGGSKMGHSDRGPREGEAYGVAGLTQKLQGVHFPIRKDELLNQYGNEKFQWTKNGETLTLKECLKNAPDEIESITQITHAVGSFK